LDFVDDLTLDESLELEITLEMSDSEVAVTIESLDFTLDESLELAPKLESALALDKSKL
jgi:hypothetical protein